ncbi:MAG TPA: type II secretion system F family protein [Candidatus Ozemobacteraceae bacterium]|nr:type II secretion system F family protein [Candidatus Ozemobacteraceae bacterium]
MLADAKNTNPYADDLMTFTRLMQAAEASKLNFPKALRELASRLPDGQAQLWANTLSDRMARGHSLAEAVRSLEGIDQTLAALLSVPGGFGFESLLTAYSRYLLLFARLAEQIRTALLYPLIILWIALMNVVILNAYVFPAMKAMFLEQKQTVPVVIRLLYFLDPAMYPFALALPLFIAFLAITGTKVWLTAPAHEIPATLFGKLLLLSQIARAERIGRFQFLLALFIRAGFRLTDAIRFSAGLGTGILAAGLIDKAERLERGDNVACVVGDDAVLMPICGCIQSKSDPDDLADLLETASSTNISHAGRLIGRIERFGIVIGLAIAAVIVLIMTIAFFDPYFTLIRGAV